MTEYDLGAMGLSSARAAQMQEQFGKNELVPQKKTSFFMKLMHIIAEPMFLLLIAAAAIYFFLGEPRDGAIMLIFVAGIIAIEAVQEWKTDRTLNALKDLSAPHITVIRDGSQVVIPSADLVPGDIMLISEGVKIPADGEIIMCSDLRVDESSLTGESEEVWKAAAGTAEPSSDYWRKDYCYAGTLVTQGTAAVHTAAIGVQTEYGKIGAGAASAPELKTPLQKQTAGLVRTSGIAAGILLVLVGVITYFNIPDHGFKERLIESVLSGITLAMAMIPEEFPVILTVYLSLGAWRLAKKHSLVRKLPSVETLGAISVLCVDKTGTITMNKMTVQRIWMPDGDKHALCETMGMACETQAYDPMEKAMLSYCESIDLNREQLFDGELLYEYPFTNESKMMGHVWRKNEAVFVAAKGSPESLLGLCDMSEEERRTAERTARDMALEGLRVIAVASAPVDEKMGIPAALGDYRLTLKGLAGLADPPREGVGEDIALCARAGIRVVMITGDNGITASSIARKIGMENSGNIINGDMLDAMGDEELREAVKTVSIFSRVIPEHKMRIVRAFRANGEVVAMTGDGVNDAPALKYADIGIAMGKRGSEVSREAADLVLMDDNFTTIVETVRDGRRIYDNIRKAVGYVFAVHIPIALSSLLAPLLGVAPAALLLLPLHVVLLELIIDPTCSIVLERQPAEKDIMERPPRAPGLKLLNSNTLVKGVVQGLVIFAASFGLYYYTLAGNVMNAQTARTMGLGVVIFSNIFLVIENSSEHDSALLSLRQLAKDAFMWVILCVSAAMLPVIIYTPLSGFLKLAPLSAAQFLTVLGAAAVAVFWYELVKYFKKRIDKSKKR